MLLVEDTIVRSTTMRALVSQLRERGGAREVHVRVACPPIIAPCFYGIDMSTISELFAPKFMDGIECTPEIEQQMAKSLNADSLRYLTIDSIARSIDLPSNTLCQACINTRYPTTAGTELYQVALENLGAPAGTRTYDTTKPATTRT